MSVLIRNHLVYERVFYGNEAHFEDIAKKLFAEIFEKFLVIDFKPLVVGDQGIRRRPDIALVHRHYRMWVVVEVELEHHSLNQHVFPQMEALATGAYDDTHADKLAQACSEIDSERMRDLIAFEPPQIMTLVNSRSVLDKGWEVLESDLRVNLTFLEVYRAETGDSIFNLSGYIPQIRPERIVGAKKHRFMNALVCSKPNAIPGAHGASIRMYYDGKPYFWKVLKTVDSAVLMPNPTLSLRKDRNYEILRADGGNLVLRLS